MGGQDHRMRRLNQVWKRRLLAGAAAWAFLCALGLDRSAEAQVLPPGPADQAVGGDGFYMEANSMIRDDEHHTWVAKGAVEARYKGKVLRADEVDYNQTNGVVTALGDVQLLSPDGTSEFAKTMTLDQDFKAGVALAFSTRQEPNTKIVADEALRLNKDSMALNKAVFTVCDICAQDGEPETPTWSIQADQVIQDHEHNIIFYKNAVIRVKGLPVMYTPVFWHTDPTANGSIPARSTCGPATPTPSSSTPRASPTTTSPAAATSWRAGRSPRPTTGPGAFPPNGSPTP